MKRVVSLVLMLAVLVTLAIVLPGGYYVGKEVSAAGKKVASISIKSKPVKLKYKVGEKLNVKGLKLTVRYSDRTRKTVSSGYTCVPIKLKKAGTNKVTVKYKGKKASFYITVSKAVKSVKIKSKPLKLQYKVGEKLSAKGLKLTVTYSDRTSQNVTSGFSCTPTKLTKEGTQKITVRYGGKSASFSVTVSKPAASSTTAAKTTTAARTTTTTAASTTGAATTGGATTGGATTGGTTPTQTKPQHMKYIKNPDHKSKYYIVVYTGSQSAVVYGKDAAGDYSKQIRSFTVSTGKKSSSPTKTGMYKIKAKYRWRLLVGPCYGQYCSSIGNNYLFHSAPYDKQRADTLQNEEYDKLGTAASHGCIRMCVRDSKWIYDNCPIGTQVNVVNASGPAGAGVPQRDKGAEYKGWDPSDKWAADNPYFKVMTTTETLETTATSATAATSAATASSTTSAASQTSATSASPTTSATSAATSAPAA